MGELILCNRKETDVPYYLEQNMINIYSLEELNWYILNHTEYLDDSFVSDDLISWIAEELKDRELAGQLKEAVRKKITLAKKVRLLMDACGFCTKKEKDEIEYALAEVENKSEIECMKIRADRSLMNHRYVMAIREYMRLLQKEEAGKLAASVIGKILELHIPDYSCTGMRHDALRKLMTIITIRHVCGRWKKHGGWQHRMKRNRFMKYQKNCKRH